MKTLNGINYESVETLLKQANERTTYPSSSVQLHSLALTQFAKEIEKKGGVILKGHVQKMKINGEYDSVCFESYLAWTYNGVYKHYIQFDRNPFFSPMGYIEHFTNQARISTGLTELPDIWNNVNEYSPEENNVKQLVKNLHEADKYLKELSMIHRDKYVKERDSFQQCIYTF